MIIRVGVIETGEGVGTRLVSMEVTSPDATFVQRVIIQAGAAREIARQMMEAAKEAESPIIKRFPEPPPVKPS